MVATVTMSGASPFTVKRADSGYGSLHSTSHSKRNTSRRNSSISTSATLPSSSASITSSHRHNHSRTQPSRRASGTQIRQSMYRKPSPPAPTAYYHFPPPAITSSVDNARFSGNEQKTPRTASLSIHPIAAAAAFTASIHGSSSALSSEHDLSGENSATFVPPTTQYWTSDRTRRAEYAAIDSANRGVKGWLLRNLLPDCLVSKQNKQHVAFDDDSGSVRRYRLDLDDEDEEAAAEQGRKKRMFSWAPRH